MAEEQNVVSLEERRAELAQKKANAKKWGKSDIFAKAGEAEDEYFERVDAIIPIRRLTAGEWGKLEEIQSRGVTLSGTPPAGGDDARASNMSGMRMSINIAESVSSERLAKEMACAYGMSVNGESYTLQDIQNVPNPGLIDDISDRIYVLSGVKSEATEAIRNFRKEQGGGDDSVDASDGVSDSE